MTQDQKVLRVVLGILVGIYDAVLQQDQVSAKTLCEGAFVYVRDENIFETNMTSTLLEQLRAEALVELIKGQE